MAASHLRGRPGRGPRRSAADAHPKMPLQRWKRSQRAPRARDQHEPGPRPASPVFGVLLLDHGIRRETLLTSRADPSPLGRDGFGRRRSPISGARRRCRPFVKDDAHWRGRPKILADATPTKSKHKKPHGDGRAYTASNGSRILPVAFQVSAPGQSWFRRPVGRFVT